MSFFSNSSAWLRQRNTVLTFLSIALFTFSFAVNSSVAINVPIRLPASPRYQGRSVTCPARCAASGPNPGNWSLYHNFEQLASCKESLFYSFSFSDPVDDPDSFHRIHTCTSFGPDWATLPVNTSNLALQSKDAPAPVNGTYQIGFWPSSEGLSVSPSLATLVKQLRQYLSNGFGAVDRPTIIFASYGSTSVGLYVGQGLQSQGVGDVALAYLERSIAGFNASLGASVAMQFCEPGQTSHHVFGLMATGNGTFAAVQEALTSWSKAECLTLPSVQNVTGKVPLATPLYSVSSNSSNIGVNLNSNSTYASADSISSVRRRRSLAPRSTCSTAQVVSGDTCFTLAEKCGITPAQFTSYNSESNECSSLIAGEHVCCSAGTLPDFAPKPQSDGTCATYTVQPDDSCATIAAAYGLTVDDINNFNTDTWAWNTCSPPLYAHEVICLSEGNPPMPAPVSNAICGPQVPGTPTPPSGTNISQLNECPLNACCDVWGQCGVTAEFCTNTGTGAPGTAANGTDGCISNCGTEMVLSSPPATYRSIAYYEGYNLQRPCLYQDVSQIDTSVYTHIYFSFGVLSSSYVVQIPDKTTLFEFTRFTQIQGAKRILSIGGWAFSTDPSTYMIFREGVTAANRLTMATNIANFIKEYDLDGVNIDWEYPGAPDIPGIPAASPDDGDNYLAFLAILRNLLDDREVTIAAPSSYWYLKGFPIKKMAPLLDYIIYMTYDLHGQWDSDSQWSQLGCPTGNCLRSDVNLTETISALVMITKAGVPSNQVVVGVTSYGRSFAMAEAGCYGPECTFLGSADDSQAEPGPFTQSPGYIANAEIEAILADPSRVNESYIDTASNSNILVYDNTQWVGWMSDGIKASRRSLYKGLAMGGTTDWATDLQKNNSPPYPAKSWAGVIDDVVLDKDPYVEGNRTGNWTFLTCSDPAIQDALYMPCAQRWSELDASDAWSDAISIWDNIDEQKLTGSDDERKFSYSLMNTFHVGESTNCGLVAPGGSCSDTYPCSVFEGFGSGGSGPAAMVIYESLTVINSMYSQFFDAISVAAGTYIDNQLQDFESTFAPVPPAPSDEWLVILTNLLGLGLTVVAAPYFDGVFESLPALSSVLGEAGADTAKDITNAAVAFGAAIASAAIPEGEPGHWTAQSQDSFTATLGSVISGWANVTQNELWNLFNGSETSITLLTQMIANGNLIEGSGAVPSVSSSTTPETTTQIESSINKAFFGFAIPSVWAVSGTDAFVVDSGYNCSAQNPLSDYMTAATQEATYSCYNDKLYYLVRADGKWSGCPAEKKLGKRADCPDCGTSECGEDATYFTAPPGLSSVGGDAWGGITLDDLIKGSVRTYVANGNANGGPVANPLDQDTLQDLSSQDITTPGYIRLPVCSPQVAWASWSNPSQSNASAPNYPCNPLQGVTKCSGYTYVDQTTSASPLVSDCKTIIQNIQGTNGEWTTGIDRQRAIATYGSCKFGVQNVGVTGDVTYYTGSQDIVTIITEAIAEYEWEGRVGAKGYMECDGDAGHQKVKWGLY
ncbi:glycoside hydrolase family 18 protein [Aspergillus aculeatinus CBS 121060]|uniref:Glycoside hydrolase family 18 protein n=1 Tax=Aspergillus aculeatinus CBS 121060 TaxID=1448322 RepID=A0ACD1GUH1_9EURO|nr:glycoside hydrolase family 18 protein [Aspergillus aculeatinus CBS 121060]RAH64784.1 glycoside hydrolase family 18 protein [Aspergillus aculeatinus CBS 121060]